jgi:hypothetical protein
MNKVLFTTTCVKSNFPALKVGVTYEIVSETDKHYVVNGVPGFWSKEWFATNTVQKALRKTEVKKIQTELVIVVVPVYIVIS